MTKCRCTIHLEATPNCNCLSDTLYSTDKLALCQKALGVTHTGKIPVIRSEYKTYLVRDLMDYLNNQGYDVCLVDLHKAKDKNSRDAALSVPAWFFKEPKPWHTVTLVDRIWCVPPQTLMETVISAEEALKQKRRIMYLTDLWDDRFIDSETYKVLTLSPENPDSPSPRYYPPKC